MFDSLKLRIYKNQVVQRVENQLIEHLGKDVGGECAGAFATAVLNSDIPNDLVDQFKNTGLSVNDAALAFYDASITAFKKVLPNVPPVNLATLLEQMEIGLDRMFLSDPGVVVPRNGKAGPMMADFTTDGVR